MTRVELIVAIRDSDEGRHRVDPAAEQLEHIQRRLVRPVDIFENHDCGLRAQRARQVRKTS